MTDPRLILFLALGAFAVFHIVSWARGAASRAAAEGGALPDVRQTLVGFVTNFFDTLGIGSFAPTTAWFRFWKTVPDERIPGTLNVGHTLPTITQAFIFIAIVNVDFVTLISLIAASIVGAWLGAGVVAGWSRRKIQLGMGVALGVAALLFILANLGIAPGGGTALSLDSTRLILGVVGNFVLGALMTLGIGLYAPCLIMISLMGMDPRASFPIMMGSCAFLMPVASARFVKAGAFAQRPALGLTLGGIPAVLIAALIVKSLEMKYVRWGVVVVVLYTAITMLRAAIQNQDPAAKR